jgi:hypothetical protein
MTTTKATVARWLVGAATVGWIAVVLVLLWQIIGLGFAQDNHGGTRDAELARRSAVLGVTLFVVAVGIPVITGVVAWTGELHRTACAYMIFAMVVAALLCPLLANSVRGLTVAGWLGGRGLFPSPDRRTAQLASDVADGVRVAGFTRTARISRPEATQALYFVGPAGADPRRVVSAPGLVFAAGPPDPFDSLYEPLATGTVDPGGGRRCQVSVSRYTRPAQQLSYQRLSAQQVEQLRAGRVDLWWVSVHCGIRSGD